MGIEILGRWWGSRQKQNATSDDNPTSIRGTRYADIYTAPVVRKQHALADIGAYYVVNSGQTGITGPSNPNLNYDPIIAIQNTDITGGKHIYLDYFNVTTAVIDVPNTGSDDIILSVSTYPAGTKVLFGAGTVQSPMNVNQDSSNVSIASVYAGNIAISSSFLPKSSIRTIVGERVIRGPSTLGSQSEIVDNNYHITFGSIEAPMAGLLLHPSGSSNPGQLSVCVNAPPIVIPPAECVCGIFVGIKTAVFTTAPTYLIELGYWEY